MDELTKLSLRVAACMDEVLRALFILSCPKTHDKYIGHPSQLRALVSTLRSGYELLSVDLHAQEGVLEIVCAGLARLLPRIADEGEARVDSAVVWEARALLSRLGYEHPDGWDSVAELE